MKIIVTLIITAIFGFSAQVASAQAFKAKEGFTAALKTAADSGVVSGKILGALTLGDTTSLIALPVKIEFDMSSGKSLAWMYFIGGKYKNTGRDTVMAIGLTRLFVFVPISVDISSLGPVTMFFNNPLPDNVIDSDAMATKIRADAAYKTFSTAHPDLKPLLVPLSVSILPQFFSTGTPLWQLTFGGSLLGGGTGPALACEVHAVTGETKCQDISTSVEDIIADNSFSLAPNPATDAVRFAVPDALRGGMMSVSVVNAVGQAVFSNNLETSAAESVVVPVEMLAGGVYRLVCSANGRTAGATFVVAR